MIEYLEMGATKSDTGLHMDAQTVFREQCRALADGRYTIRVERERKQAGPRMRRYWFGVVVVAFSEHTGYEKDEMHEILKYRLNPQTREWTDPATGEVSEMTFGGSTQNFTNAEWLELIRKAQQLGSELDIYIPDPNERAA